MAIARRIYHRTRAGHEAYARLDSDLPRHYRQVLALVHQATHFDEIVGRLRQYSALQVLGWLEDFEAIGLVESVSLEWLAELAAAGNYSPEALTTLR